MHARLERLSLPCPCCGGVLKIRSSRQLSDVVREVYAECHSTEHAPLTIKYFVEIVADLHNGSYDDGLHIPASLRKQALAPVKRVDARQVCIPGCEPVKPAIAPLTAHELRCPKCQSGMRYIRAKQINEKRRELFTTCFNPECDGKFKVVVEAASILGGDVPGLDLPRWVRPQALAATPAPDPNQLSLPGLPGSAFA